MSVVSSVTAKLVALKSIKGVGPATLREICEFTKLDTSEMISLVSKKFPRINSESYALGQSLAQKQIREAESRGHTIVSFMDPEYPTSLRSLSDRPPILYAHGNISFLNRNTVAVIGTREPTKHGSLIAERVTRRLCTENWNIVSGLAKGIDTIAHQICLDSEMKTCAVMAQGLDTIYPKENIGLAERIIQLGGALVSEYPYGTPVRAAQLVQRDKVQAALAAGVILVQSGEKGGSLHASRAIIEYKRPLIVVGQSKSDTSRAEEKSLANLILLGNDKSEACRILKTASYPDELIIKMHSRANYPLMLRALEDSLASYDDIDDVNTGFSPALKF